MLVVYVCIWQLPVQIVEIDNFGPSVDCFNLYFIFLCLAFLFLF